MTVDFDRVEARGLVKMYGSTRALSGVDVTLAAGAITVVEGPNGSGKSSLLAILAMLARPTRGDVRYGTFRATERAIAPRLRRQLGVLSHHAMVYPDLTGRENLRLFARLYEIDDASPRIESLFERFEIGTFGDRPTRTYSRGQLQRIGLARAVLHTPKLLLLDEPSTGLDRRGVERLVAAVTQERARGAIVLIVTHDLELIEGVADRRVRLERGRVVAPEAA